MGKFNNLIICLIGKSGCGKSTIAKRLNEHYGYEILKSYTTRKKRDLNDDDHSFISKEEYDVLPNKVATTLFNNNYYCATKEQIDNCDLYIIDLNGLKQLKELYTACGGTKKIISIYIDVPMEHCLERMQGRGDSEEQSWSRLQHDYYAFKGALGECDYVTNGVSNNTWLDVAHIISINKEKLNE